jgi:hypothetical protein
MTERIFNIFMFFEEGLTRQYGVRHHAVGGSDHEKLDYLRAAVDHDFKSAKRFDLSRSFTLEQWRAAQRLGNVLGLFEEAFTTYRASATPIFCVTPIVDGIPRIDAVTGPEPYRGEAVSAQAGLGSVPDYLVTYVSDNGFRFPDLIHDDYFHAIRTLFNARLYVSCAKLLMCCVDTLSFVEFGDVRGNFTQWVDTFVDLSVHDLTAAELWEFRNSVLHMTNLASKKVLSGKVSPIMPYVGTPASLPKVSGAPKPFNLYGLISSVGDAIGRWAETYNADPEKMITFIERYDLTISDSRMAWVSCANQTAGT